MLLHFLFLISLVLCLLSSRTLLCHQFLRLKLVSLKNIIKFAYILAYFFFEFHYLFIIKMYLLQYKSVQKQNTYHLDRYIPISTTCRCTGISIMAIFFRRLSHASLNNPTSHSFHNYRK